MLNATTALNWGERGTLKEVADLIAKHWAPEKPSGPTKIALSGLVAIESDGAPPLVEFEESVNVDEIRERGFSPALTVCQLYGIAASKGAPQDVRREWLQALTDAIAHHKQEFRKRWSRLHPRTRRYLLRATEQALRLIRENGSLSPLAAVVSAGSSTPEADIIWDDDMTVRARVAQYGEPFGGASLLLRQAEIWKKRVQERHLQGRGLIRFLLSVIALVRNSPAVTRESVHLKVGDLIDTAIAVVRPEGGSLHVAVSGLKKLIAGEPLYEAAQKLPTGLSESRDPLVRVLVAARSGTHPNTIDIEDLRKELSDAEYGTVQGSLGVGPKTAS